MTKKVELAILNDLDIDASDYSARLWQMVYVEAYAMQKSVNLHYL